MGRPSPDGPSSNPMSTRCQIEFYEANPTDAAEPEARLDDPEWAAAEFITQFRLPSNWNAVEQRVGGEPLFDGTRKNFINRYRGNIYVTQHIHPDIEYLYRVECRSDRWVIHVFTPTYDDRHDIRGFE